MAYDGTQFQLVDAADARIVFTAADGIVISGDGSARDVTLKNDAGNIAMSVPTGTQNVDFDGNLTMTTDAASISMGVNSDISLTHEHDVGVKLKNANTADDKPIVLTLQTGETDIAADDVLGAIRWQAPDEATSGDSRLIAAGIEAISEGDFSSSSNATKLSFKTGASEAATEKVSISSAGILTIQGEGSNTTNVTQGVSKCWANIDGSGTPSISDSYNCSALVDNATGDFSITIATDLASADYVVGGSANTGAAYTNALVNKTLAAGSVRFVTSSSGSVFDSDNTCVLLLGDLS